MNKKVIPYIYGVTAAAVTIATAGVMSSLILDGSGEEQLPQPKNADEAKRMANVVLEQKCAACHGENPEYSKLVNFFAFGKLRRDVEGAQRAFTIKPNPDVRSESVDLAKMDYVLQTRNMPPVAYTIMHPGSKLSQNDIKLLRYYYGENEFSRVMEPLSLKKLKAQLPPEEYEAAEARLLLGHLLFMDPKLSKKNKVSCYSCHDLTKGGTDNLAKSEGVPGTDGKPQLGGVNAPTVFNAAGHIKQFWDGRAADLQEQAGGPPMNPVEMGYSKPEDWLDIAAKLEKDECYQYLFKKAYGDAGITAQTITDAIAFFELTLTTPDSDFDRYLSGNKDAMTKQQVQGMKDFKAYGCATCHSGSTLGGQSFEYINTNADLRKLATPEDYKEGAFGLMDFTKKEEHKDMFRVPTLRNVALTAPYFHTGSVDNLEDAVRIMFETQSDYKASTKTIKNVTAFLKAQTGKYKGLNHDDGEGVSLASLNPSNISAVRKIVADKIVSERIAKEQAKAKAEAEAKAKDEEEARLKAEAEAKAKAEEEARLKAEAEAKAKDEEEARLKAEAEAKAKAEEEARLKAEAEAKAKAEEEARLKAAAEAKAKKERLKALAEEARRKAEEARREAEAKAKAEEEARLKAEAEAKAKAEEEARLKAETEAKAKAEEEARLKAEAEAKAKAEEEARLKAEAEAMAKAEEEARLKAEAEAMAKAEEEARLKAEAEAKAKEEARRWEEARKAAAEKRAQAIQSLGEREVTEAASAEEAPQAPEAAPQPAPMPVQSPIEYIDAQN